MEKKGLLEAENDEELADLLMEEKSLKEESPSQYKARWRSIRVVYLTLCLSALEFSIGLPSIWPYLQKIDQNVSPQFLGWTVGGFSLCQLIGTFMLGVWGQYRHAIEPLVAGGIIRTIGNVLYVFAGKHPGASGRILVLLARLMIGFSTGDKAVCRAIISQSTRRDERRDAFAVMLTIEVTGYALGPAFQAVAVPVVGKGLTSSWIDIDIYNIPGWIGIIIELVDLALFLAFLIECNVGVDTTSSSGDLPMPNISAILIIAMCWFYLFTSFSVTETVATPLLQAEYGWTKAKAVFYSGIILSSSGFIAVLSLVVIKIVKDRLEERKILLLGTIITLVSCIMILPWGDEYPKPQTAKIVHIGNSTKTILSSGCPMSYSWCQSTPKIYLSQLLTSYFTHTVGYIFASLVALTLYSNVIGPRKQSLYMASMTSVGSAARFLGPVMLTPIFIKLGPRWLFVVILALSAIVVAGIVGFYRILVPFEEYCSSKTKKDGHD